MIERGKCIVDASVAVKWYIPEAGSDRAAQILSSGNQLLAPDLLVAELSNVLWKKVLRVELTVDEASDILDTFLASGSVTLHPVSLLVRQALAIAVRYQHPIYDACYLALAATENCRFVTADEKLVLKLRGTELEQFARSLSNT